MRILMLIDSLDVGGAETHVEILASELYALGHEIFVVSEGGIIRDRLAHKGIKCIYAPAVADRGEKAEKSPMICRFLVARKIVGQTVRRVNPDLIHAHTRTTAALAKSVCKKYNVPLVVTAHAKFDMRFPKSYLSEWGARTIAVSDDIGAHLVKHGLSESQIEIINNGVIVPEKIKPCTEYSDTEGIK